MRIYDELNLNVKEVVLDGSPKIKVTEISEKVDGKILNAINQKINQINYDRFKNLKKEVNTIVMNPYLYNYICLLEQSHICLTVENRIIKLFGLKIVLRDDYEIDEIDIYRDVTEEMGY